MYESVGPTTKELSETNWAQFQKSFNDFVDFLKQNQTQKLRLFQILKWCREPLGTPRKVPYKGGVVVLTPDSDPLKNEFYFQTVYALFLRAIQIVNPVLYQRGFPQKKEEFFLDQLAYRLYTSNYRDRLKQGISKAGDFRKTSTSFLWLLLFAQKRDDACPGRQVQRDCSNLRRGGPRRRDQCLSKGITIRDKPTQTAQPGKANIHTWEVHLGLRKRLSEIG